MKRPAALAAAIGVIALAAIWGGLAYLVLAYRIDDYCEDAGVCTEAAPIRAAGQLLIALAGIFCAIRLARSGFRAAAGEPPGEDGGRWVVPTAAALVLWLIVVATLRFP